MPRKNQQGDRKEIFRSIASGLRTAATRPNIYGYKPHPKQYTFHSSTAIGRLFLGGNRSGKTVGGAVEAAWWLTGKHPFQQTPPPPVRGRIVAVDFLQGVEKIVRPEVARWMPLSELKGGSWSSAYDKELRTLTLENDSFVEFMSYDQDLEKFAGTSRHFTWFDEEPPQDIFTECKMRLLDVAGHWWITMTPVEGMTWTYDDLYEAARTSPHIDVVQVDQGENPYLNREEIDAFLAGLSEDERKARIHGKFVQIGGFVYRSFSDRNLVDSFRPPKEWLHVASLDHGFNNPTCWLWGAVDPDGRIFIFDEHYESGEIVAYHAQRVHERNIAHGREPDYYVGDPSIRNTDPITGTSVLLEYQDYGIPVVLGNNDVRAGINRVARYLGDDSLPPKLFITRNCINLIWEMQRLRWSTWSSKKVLREKNKKEEPQKKDDHACDSLRYLVASRPEMDVGTDVPESRGPLGAAVAVVGHSVVDPGVRRLSQPEYVDYNLGSEY